MITVSSGSITIQALISPAGALSVLQGSVESVAAGARPGTANPRAKPPVAVRAVVTNCRRENAFGRSGLRTTLSMAILPISNLHQRGGATDGPAPEIAGWQNEPNLRI